MKDKISIIPSSANRATQSNIDLVESTIQASLSDEYKNWILVNDTGFFSDLVAFECERLGHESPLGVTGLLPFSADAVRRWGYWIKEVDTQHFPFAEGPAGDMFCLSIGADDYGSVQYWRQEEADPAKAYTTIADNFTEFVKGLYLFGK